MAGHSLPGASLGGQDDQSSTQFTGLPQLACLLDSRVCWHGQGQLDMPACAMQPCALCVLQVHPAAGEAHATPLDPRMPLPL